LRLLKGVGRALLIGYGMFRMHLTSEVSSSLNALFWAILLLAPTILFTNEASTAVKVLLPAIVVANMLLLGSGLGMEYAVWLVGEGVLDDLRLSGVSVFYYTASTFPLELVVIGFLPFILSVLIISCYLGIGLAWFLSFNPLVLVASIPVIFAAEVFASTASCLLYLKNPFSRSLFGIIQIALLTIVFIPPEISPGSILGRSGTWVNGCRGFETGLRFEHDSSRQSRCILNYLNNILHRTFNPRLQGRGKPYIEVWCGSKVLAVDSHSSLRL